MSDDEIEIIYETLYKLQALFPSWLSNFDNSYLKDVLDAWWRSLEGLSREQLNFGINQLSLGLTEFDKYCPNSIEFRKICLEIPRTRGESK